MPASQHLYIRTLAKDDNSSLASIARRIRQGSRVLDIGCGSGSLGKYLSSQLACHVDGITYSPDEARLAQESYRNIWVFNLESEPDQLDVIDTKYDYVICADILEHIRNPDQILSKCHALLAEDGDLVISIPNVAYSGVIASLLQGRFPYSDEGLLDRTHVKFFTRSSALELLHRAGWDIFHTESIALDLDQSEFGNLFLNLSPAIQRELLSQPDAGAYQFLFACKPAKNNIEHATLNSVRLPIVGFSVALYWTTNRTYSESQKIVSRGEIGLKRQRLRFLLPSPDSPLTQLRLDPADRPGFLRLYSCRLVDPTGNSVWQWLPDDRPLFRTSKDIFWGGGLFNDSGVSLLLTDSDPQIELDIPSQLLVNLPPASYLEVELSWPASLDFEALSSRLSGLEFEHIHAIEAGHATLTRFKGKIHASFESEMQALRRSQEELSKNLLESSAIAEKMEELHRDILSLSMEKQNLEHEVRALRNLLVVRITRPLAKWWNKKSTN